MRIAHETKNDYRHCYIRSFTYFNNSKHTDRLFSISVLVAHFITHSSDSDFNTFGFYPRIYRGQMEETGERKEIIIKD